jgi:TfoX/Sxy family transcriptional regulator of competence genes
MQMPRPTEADKERFQNLVPSEGNVEVKPMFGNLAAFVNGNMFMGLFGSDIGVKLSPTDQEPVRQAGGGDFGPAERPMGGYVTLPTSADRDQLGKWISSALAYVAALPPKKPKGGKG